MSVLKRHSDKTEARPAKRRSDAFSDTEAMSESKSESEYEEGRSNSRGYRNGATSIGRRLVKRRRAGRWEATPQSQVSPRAVTPPSTSPLEESLEIEGKVSEEEEEYDYSQSPTPPSNVLLKWKNMPYPGLPVSEHLHFRCALYHPRKSLTTDNLSLASRVCVLVRIRTDLFYEGCRAGLEITCCSLARSQELCRLRHLLAASVARKRQ